jgi:hypothetical protein
MDNLPKEIKWRGSTYVLDSIKDNKVLWTNLTSRHKASCSIESWKRSDPYEGKYA